MNLANSVTTTKLQGRLRKSIHSVDITLTKQSAVGVHWESSGGASFAGPNESARLASLNESQPLESEQNRTAKAVVNLGDVNIVGGEPGLGPKSMP